MGWFKELFIDEAKAALLSRESVSTEQAEAVAELAEIEALVDESGVLE